MLLIIVGLWAYFSSGSGASPTALIPALLGVLLAGCAAVGLRSTAGGKHAMHAAAAIALLGVVGVVGQLVFSPAAGSDNAGTARAAGLLTLALCLIVLAVAIRSFMLVRRSG